MIKLISLLLALSLSLGICFTLTSCTNPQNGYDDFNAGDIVTLRSALYAIFLPSSNPTAITLARITGNKIIEG